MIAYVLDSVRRETNQSSAMVGKLRRIDQAPKRDDLSRVASVPRGTFQACQIATVSREPFKRMIQTYALNYWQRPHEQYSYEHYFKRSFQSQVLCKCK